MTSSDASAEGLRLAIFTDTYPPQMNGVAATLERLAGAVRDRGGEVRVVTPADPNATGDAAVRRCQSVPFWAYPHLRIAMPAAGRIARELRAWHPTLIHAATPFGVGLAGRRVAAMLGTPLVTSYHTSFSEYAKFYRLGRLGTPGWAFLRWFHNSGRRTYCPTRAVQADLDHHGFTNTRVWGRGVDMTRFNPSFRSAGMRSRLNAGDDTVVVAYIGRIAAEKGLDVALAAMRKLENAPNLRFVVVGEGPYESACRRDAPAGTVFTGRLTGRELSEAYASADLFVFPSVTDTFGNVLVEAMASGLPVIGAEAGPTRELLSDGGGTIVPAGDADELAATISRLAGDAATRRRLSEEAVQSARARSWDSIFDDLVRDYRRVEAGG